MRSLWGRVGGVVEQRGDPRRARADAAGIDTRCADDSPPGAPPCRRGGAPSAERGAGGGGRPNVAPEAAAPRLGSANGDGPVAGSTSTRWHGCRRGVSVSSTDEVHNSVHNVVAGDRSSRPATRCPRLAWAARHLGCGAAAGDAVGGCRRAGAAGVDDDPMPAADARITQRGGTVGVGLVLAPPGAGGSRISSWRMRTAQRGTSSRTTRRWLPWLPATPPRNPCGCANTWRGARLATAMPPTTTAACGRGHAAMTLGELLPHAGAMVLLDRVIAWDDGGAVRGDRASGPRRSAAPWPMLPAICGADSSCSRRGAWSAARRREAARIRRCAARCGLDGGTAGRSGAGRTRRRRAGSEAESGIT